MSDVENTTEQGAVLDSSAQKQQLSFADLLPRVASEFKKPAGSQLKDILAYCMRGNKLSVDEYYNMRLFDDAVYSAEDKKRFVGLQNSRRIWTKLMAANRYLGTVDDKFAYERMMAGLGIATTETVAIVGGHYPSGATHKIGDLAGFEKFLKSAEFPLFGKPINSLQSLGSIRIDGFTAAKKMVKLLGGKLISTEKLWAEIESEFDGDYLIQKCITSHDSIQTICGAGVPTVRVMTLDNGNGPKIFRACIKLTGSGNAADNFWRGGNLLSPVDVETGSMGKALTQMGIDGEFLSHHPSSGAAIEGVVLPHWESVKDVALQAASLMKGAIIFGFDIAISQNGPVLVEANNDPHLIMMQIAHQQGVLGDEISAAMAYSDAQVAARKSANKAIIARELKEGKGEVREAASLKKAAN